MTLTLVLALCLTLAAPAFAAEAQAGDTTVVDAHGVTYELSKPILRVEPMPADVSAPVDTVYVVPAGTQIVPRSGPAGYTPGRDAENRFIVFEKAENDSVTIWTETLYQGLGGSDENGITLDGYDGDKYTKYRGFMSQHWLGGTSTDVTDGDWFAEPVKWAVEKNITTGTSATTFSPANDCTVAQILTFLWRAAGEPAASAVEGIDAGEYYGGAVAWAVEQGMISAADFNAAQPCTRGMAVRFIWQTAGSPKADAANFTDVPADSPYAAAVAWAVAEGVTTGTSETTFSPDTVCTRGHIVTFLYRAFAE